MVNSSVAIAVFVKTPGVSPVKTRLARSVGEAFAEAFYRLSLDSIEEVVEAAATSTGGGIAPYWAVAEAEQLRAGRWSTLPVVSQLPTQNSASSGAGLGERLDRVYRSLLAAYAGVLLIGADSPHTSAPLLARAATLLQTNDYVMGRSEDGGFYLFGGRRPVDTAIWTAVTYSSEKTADELVWALGQEPVMLPATFDVDTIDELIWLEQELRRNAASLLPSQKRLGQFLSEHLEVIRSAAVRAT